MPLRSIRHIRLLAAVLAALLWLIAPPPAASAGEAEPAAVRIGYYKNAIFQKGAQPGAARSGYAYEYCLKIAEYAGWKYEYVYGSFGELYDRLLKGEIDLLAGLARTEDRTGRIGYPEHPMGEMPYLLMKRQGDSRISADPASLSGMSIGAVDGAPAAEDAAARTYTYRVLVKDENDQPLQEVSVQFCDDTSCRYGETDEQGCAVFEVPEEKVYDVHIAEASDEYEYDPEEVIKTDEVSSDTTIVLKKAK